MAVFHLSFNDYAYTGYSRAFIDLILISSVDSAVAGFIMVIFYTLFIKTATFVWKYLLGRCFYYGLAGGFCYFYDV